jgi:hypothetical protein
MMASVDGIGARSKKGKNLRYENEKRNQVSY